MKPVTSRTEFELISHFGLVVWQAAYQGQRRNLIGGIQPDRAGSETDLTEDSLARKQFGAQTNYEAHHCEGTISNLSEVAEAESRLS